MNDDSLTPEAELASAALDNEVTEVERAQVAGSRSLSGELAFYADLRSRLADVPVPDEARESALAAALAVFDEIQAVSSEPEPEPVLAIAAAKVSGIAPVVSLHERRQRQYRWIGGAAAAAFVAVLAVGVLGNLGGGSDEDSASNAALFDTTGTDQKSAATPPAELAAGQAAQESASDTAEATAADEAPEAMSEPSGELEINSPAELTEWAAAPQLETADDVIAYIDSDAFAAGRAAEADASTGAAEATSAETTASPATGAASAATTGAAPGASDSSDQCPQLSIGPFAPVSYQGRQVYVVVDEANREILIVDPLSCEADDPVRLP